MTDQRISELAAVTQPLASDEFAVNQGSVSKKMTLAQIAGGDRFTAGRYYSVPNTAASGGGVVVGLGTCYVMPFFVPFPRAFDAVVWHVNTAVASSFLRLGLYADSGGLPGALIVDLGQQSGAVIGEKVVAMTQTLSGLIWVAHVAQGVIPNVIRAAAGYSPYISGTALVGGGGYAYSQTGVTAGLPNPWGATLTVVSANNSAAHLALRAA